MKKITLVLSAVLGLSAAGMAQATYKHEAPPNTGGNSAFRAPNGSQDHALMRAIFYIHPYEMTPMNLATINSVSFQVLSGTGASAPTVGNFTLWLANANHMEYAFGSNFVTATSNSMTQVYTGAYTVPNATGPSTVPITLTQPFNFTGGGLYVAYDFVSSGPFAANGATYTSNHLFHTTFNDMQMPWLGGSNASVTPISASNQFSSGFRPSLIFGATNNATNEVEVINIEAPGSVSAFIGGPQTITARVCNSSIGALTNVSVALTVAGANTHNDVIVIPNFPAGSTQTLTFSNFNPSMTGVNNMTIAALLVDQIPANNIKVWSQSVTCQNVGHNPANMTIDNSYGYSADVLFTSLHQFSNTQTLNGVKVRIGNSSTNNGKQMSAVLLNSTGGIIASGPPTNLTASTTVTFPFSTPQALTANTQYFIGVLQPSANPTYFPFAFSDYTMQVSRPYYIFNATGGTPQPILYFGHFEVLPELQVDELELSATASKTLVCKGVPVTLSVTTIQPGTSYTWNPGNTAGSITTVTLQPPGTATSGPVFYNVVGTHTASGCQTEQAVVTISVSLCTGIDGDIADYRTLNMFPNPAANGVTQIQGLQGTNTIEATNITGQVVMRMTTVKQAEILDFSNLPKGQYIVKVSNDRQEIRVFKVLTN